MRRFIVVCLTTIVGLGAVGGAGAAAKPAHAPVASARPAHAASTVHIIVLHSRSGGTVVAARVMIHGHAFPFLVDTGASVTLVNPALAKRLHLKTVGKPHRFCGVTGCSSARRVRLSNWSIGGQPLPSVVGSSSPIVGTGSFGFGLLGSDVLSKFGSVTIDYRDKVMTLG